MRLTLAGRPGNEADTSGKAWEWGWHIPTKLPHCLLCVDIIINHIINNHITRMSGTMREHTDTTLANAPGFIETHENIKHARTCFGHALILLWESTWTFTIAIQEHVHSFVNKTETRRKSWLYLLTNWHKFHKWIPCLQNRKDRSLQVVVSSSSLIPIMVLLDTHKYYAIATYITPWNLIIATQHRYTYMLLEYWSLPQDSTLLYCSRLWVRSRKKHLWTSENNNSNCQPCMTPKKQNK